MCSPKTGNHSDISILKYFIIRISGPHRYVAADGYNYYNQQQPYYQPVYPHNQQCYQPQAYQYNSNPTQHYGQHSQQYNSLPYNYRQYPYGHEQNAYGYQNYPSYGAIAIRQAPPYPSPGAQPLNPPVPHPFYHTQGTYYPTVITEKPVGPKNST